MKKVIFPLIAFVLFSCGEVKESSHTQEAEIEPIDMDKELAAIEKVRANFSLALKEGRYEDMGKWVTPDVKTVPPGGSGWDTMFALGQERGRFPYDSIIMQPTETLIMNDSMAYDWGTSRVFYTDKEDKPVELNNSFLVIMKKVNGEWKLHREVGSSRVQ